MQKPVIFSILALVLTACTLTPLQQCRSPFLRASHENRTQIEAAEEAIRVGFIFVPARTSVGVRYCLNDRGDFRLCLGSSNDGLQTFRKIRVDRAAEQAKLDVLLARRAELQASLAQCAAQFPEV